jgi:hypothetical protein
LGLLVGCSLLIFLVLHSSVLKPDFHLLGRETRTRSGLLVRFMRSMIPHLPIRYLHNDLPKTIRDRKLIVLDTAFVLK